MNLPIHILRKDLRKFGPLIVLSILVNVFGYCIVLSNLDATRVFSGIASNLTKVFHQAPLARWVTVFLLSVWVILEDRGVGDRVSWMTRPIFARQILAAKFYFLVLAVALPAGLVGIGVALWLKAPLTAALAAGWADLLFTLAVAAVFAAAAVVCSTMNRVLLFLASTFGIVGSITYCVFQLGHLELPPSPLNVTAGTNFLVAVVTASIFAMTTVGYQYTTRRTFRTALLMAVLGTAACAIVRYWPLNFWPDLAVSTSAAPTPSSRLKLAFDDSPADFRTTQEAFGDGEAYISVPVRLEGYPPTRSFTVGSVTSAFVTRDGETFSTFLMFANTVFEDKLVELSALGFSAPIPTPKNYISVIQCNLDAFKKLQGQVGRLSATVELTEKQYETIAQLPVRAGVEIIKDGHLSRIISTQFVNGGYEVGFQFAQVSPVLGTQYPVFPYKFILINTRRGEFAESHGARGSGTGSPDMNLVTCYSQFTVTRSLQSSAEAGKVDAAWLNDAELFFLVAENVTQPKQKLTLSVDALTIPMKQVTRRVIVINPDGTRNEY